MTLKWLPLLIAPALLAIACGGDGASPASSPTPTPTEPAPTRTETPEPAVQRIAYIGSDGDVWLMNADGSGEKKLFDLDLLGLPHDFQLYWSPDGSKLAVPKSPEDIVYIVSAEGETVLEVPAALFRGWSPRGDSFVVARAAAAVEESAVVVLDLEGDTVLEVPGMVFLAWSPRGDVLVVGRQRQPGVEPVILALDLGGNPVIGPVSGIQAALGHGSEPSFSSDGQHFAFFELGPAPAAFCGELRGILVDLQTAEAAPIDPDEDLRDCGNGALTFSPIDPSLLAYGDRLIDLDAGQELLPGGVVSWSPNGQLLEICRGGQVTVHDVESGTSVLEFTNTVLPDGPCWAVLQSRTGWSTDGRLLGTLNVNWQARLEDPDTPDVLHIRDIATRGHKTVSIPRAESVNFSPDGRHLLLEAAGIDGFDGFLQAPMIWLVDSDGTNLIQIEGSAATWQPQP